MNLGITTIRKPDDHVLSLAKAKSKEWTIPYFKRDGLLLEMAEKNGREGFLIYGHQLPSFWTKESVYKFHLGTSVLRIKRLQEWKSDRVCRLLPRDCSSVLDCTFGHGGDSTVFSFYLGNHGKVVSLEKSLPIYEIGKSGIESFADKDEKITEALRRIQLVHVDFHDYLSEERRSKQFDVVYFDTMFKHPVKRLENQTEGFRRAACYDELTENILRKAVGVAGKRVIVKERPFSKIFKLGIFNKIYSKKGQSTAYGVIDV